MIRAVTREPGMSGSLGQRPSSIWSSDESPTEGDEITPELRHRLTERKPPQLADTTVDEQLLREPHQAGLVERS